MTVENRSNTRIPILHLMNGIDDCSITSMVLQQLKDFGDARYEWHVAGLSGVTVRDPFEQLNARVVDFAAESTGNWSLLRRLKSYVREHQIELVHSHTPRTTVAAGFALGFRRNARLLTTKHLHAHATDRSVNGWIFSLTDRVASYLPDKIVAVSRDVGTSLQSLPGINHEKITVIQNAVDQSSYAMPDSRDACRVEFGINETDIVLGFAGRLTNVKRLDLMLMAFQLISKDFPQCRLLLAGAGEEEVALRELARDLGVDERVIWAGHRHDMPRLYAAMDVYLQSSDNEGLSLSLLQAMIAGRPVIATDVGGTREVVSEETGVLIRPGSAEVLAHAVVGLLNDSEKTQRLVGNARKFVRDEFCVSRQMRKYKEVYDGLLGGAGIKTPVLAQASSGA
ncbi:glycosyltransferase [bacterium]|nr:glycosyltransferase [bacterium]